MSSRPLDKSSITTEIAYAVRYNTLDPFQLGLLLFTRLLFRFHVRCVRLDYLRYIYTHTHTHTSIYFCIFLFHPLTHFLPPYKRDETKAHCSCHHRPLLTPTLPSLGYICNSRVMSRENRFMIIISHQHDVNQHTRQPILLQPPPPIPRILLPRIVAGDKVTPAA